MSRATRSLLAALVSTTVVVTAALVWAGILLMDQQRAVDDQRSREQADHLADAVAAGIRGKLAEAGERLSGWVSNPHFTVPAIDDAVVVGSSADGISVNPRGGLPFVPFAIPADDAPMFAVLERIEFGGHPDRAATGYRALADNRVASVRAGALLRLGRVQRKVKDYAGALFTYQRLAGLEAVRTGDLPAELAALTGRRATHLALGDLRQADVVARQILHGLDSGRWLIGRGTAEFYREPFSDARPASWALADALSDVWRDAEGRVTSRGQRVLHSAVAPAANVLVLWRSNGPVNAAAVAFADRFFDLPQAGGAWQLVDPEGRVVTGETAVPSPSRARIIGSGEYPWILHMSAPSPEPAGRRSRTMLVAMLAAVLAFVWGASYFIARAIRREAAVARLQSDFVAAVSHEFRSPLTTIRQVAEMLDEDRVRYEDRRHTYYRMLAAEAARLQRLVETLLHFGRMQAGAERYRFDDLDVAALVRDVVHGITPRAREAGKVVEIDGPDAAIHVRADRDALSMALSNLIDNAIKYSPGQPTVWVRCRRDRDRAAICVIDRGVGIPRGEQRTIFARFVRGRAAIAANIRGTGVGLSMVEQIATAHGGEVRVESEPGRGSTFTLLLPAAG